MCSSEGAFTIVAGAAESGKRLDAVVAHYVPECSRSFAAHLIRDGCVRVHDISKKPGYRLKAGDIIQGSIPPPRSVEIRAEHLGIDVLYEDHDIVVINKTAGIVVHPAPGHYQGTLVNALMFHYPDLEGIGGEKRPGIVHRLDKDTSGALVIAKNAVAHAGLSQQFKMRTVTKEYQALVHGEITGTNGVITLPIGRHPYDRKRMSTFSRNPRSAETIWVVKERFNRATLLNLNLKTGRTHQIRVHCAAIQHPIVGDPVYCRRNINKDIPLLSGIERQMLHARHLCFVQPITHVPITVDAPMPADMQELLVNLKNDKL